MGHRLHQIEPSERGAGKLVIHISSVLIRMGLLIVLERKTKLLRHAGGKTKPFRAVVLLAG